jgi:hypothetical protein
MAAQATSTDFKSPKHKLISFFHSARDKWRERSLGYRKALRSLNITARDLRNSRDSWKQKYMRERERRLEMEARLEHPPPRAATPSRLTTAAASGHLR